MKQTIKGHPMGGSFRNKKNTGFIQRVLLNDKDGKPGAVVSIFSQDESVFTPAADGLVTVSCEIPDFYMAARA